MNERFIILLEKHFENELTDLEKQEFETLINSKTELKREFEEQKRIKEVLRKMKLKNPSREQWDSYWMGVYNRIERGIAWIVISIGALIFFGYSSYEVVHALINDTHTPPLAKLGVTLLIFGALILIFSLIREKIFTSKRDKYKEIQR
jgi:GR25 family glycosyltransferase involved in LPS biosynthesis